jgi:hypothetical protein
MKKWPGMEIAHHVSGFLATQCVDADSLSDTAVRLFTEQDEHDDPRDRAVKSQRSGQAPWHYNDANGNNAADTQQAVMQ